MERYLFKNPGKEEIWEMNQDERQIRIKAEEKINSRVFRWGDGQKIIRSEGRRVKGIRVLVSRSRVREREKGIKKRLFRAAKKARMKVSRKKKVSGTSRLAERAREINQGEDRRATAEAKPTAGEEIWQPKMKIKASEAKPRMAAAALEPNSSTPKASWVVRMSQKPAGG